MKRIELAVYEPVPGNPGLRKCIGQRTAQEVFEELRHRLDSTGYLPDEYFLMDDYWRDGMEIPKGADIFCTTDFGGSEGIYVDVYLKWHDDSRNKNITQSFATGKTLGETGADMDRMFLIASAITKAFHSDDIHARYMRAGSPGKAMDSVIHLNGTEQRLFIDSLVARRLAQLGDIQETERLLRRVTGSVIEFVNEVGARPMEISDFDRAVLAIQDGDPGVLREAIQRIPEKTGELLVLAAGRPGSVGRDMTLSLLSGAADIPGDLYLAACKNAVSTGDCARTAELARNAEGCVRNPDMGLYGEIIREALREHGHIAEALMKECAREQLAASNPSLMAEILSRGDLSMARQLAGSGIDVNPRAPDIIRALTWRSDNRFYFKYLVEAGMEIDSGNYAAMHACLGTNNSEAAKLLIDRGMDFDAYTEWAKGYPREGQSETLCAVREYWETRGREPEMEMTPVMMI